MLLEKNGQHAKQTKKNKKYATDSIETAHVVYPLPANPQKGST